MARFEPQGSITGDLTEAITYFVASNAMIITKGSAVTLVGGYVEFIESKVSQKLLGVAAETVTGTTASAEVGIYCDPNIVYHNDADGDLVISDIGLSFRVDSSGTTVDASTHSANSTTAFILIKRDPDGDGDASKGLFKPYLTLLGGAN